MIGDLAEDIRTLYFGNIETVLDTFPRRVWVLWSGKEKYCTMLLTKIIGDSDTSQFGLICFSSEKIAWEFCHVLRESKNEICCPVEKSFDEAREIALNRPDCSALVLFDNPDKVGLHWVK